MKLVRLIALAEADIAEAFRWYQAKEPGLGLKFMEHVDEMIEKIADNPFGHPKVIEDVRRANLQHFPYALWYRVARDGSIVMACLHGKRSPRLAEKRALRVFRSLGERQESEPS